MSQPNFNVVMLAKGKARVEIYDVIGPSRAGMIDTKLVAKQLNEAGELSEIEVRINSPGGSAYDGLAIHNILKDHPAKVNVVIDGIAGSAASLIAMAGDTVRIPSNAMIFIHEPSTFAFGTKADFQKSIEQLEAATVAGIATYVAKSGQSEEQIATWLKDEKWFTGQEAVDAGLADTVSKELPKTKAPSKASVQQQLTEARDRYSQHYALSMRATKEPEMAEQVTEPVTPPAAPVAPVPPAAPQLTAADVQAAADKAVTDERSRIAAINSVCQKAGKPEMANEFIANGTALADVQNRMFEVLCAARPPVGDAGGGDAPPAKDPDAIAKAEYAADRVTMQKAGITEEDYVTSRRISAGTEMLVVR